MLNRRKFLSGVLSCGAAGAALAVTSTGSVAYAKSEVPKPFPRLPAAPVSSLSADLTSALRAASAVQPDTLQVIKNSVRKGLSVMQAGDRNEPRTLIVVIDPRCPYCAQHFSNLRLLAKRPTIHYVLASVSGSASLRLGAAILVQPDPLAALTLALETLLNTGKPLSYSELAVDETLAAKYFSALKEQNAGLLNTGVTCVPFTVYETDTYAVKRELVLDPRQIDVFYQYGDVQGYLLALEKNRNS